VPDVSSYGAYVSIPRPTSSISGITPTQSPEYDTIARNDNTVCEPPFDHITFCSQHHVDDDDYTRNEDGTDAEPDQHMAGDAPDAVRRPRTRGTKHRAGRVVQNLRLRRAMIDLGYTPPDTMHAAKGKGRGKSRSRGTLHHHAPRSCSSASRDHTSSHADTPVIGDDVPDTARD
jgi:hypothetical protein